MKRGPKITGAMQDEIVRRVDAIASSFGLDPFTVVLTAQLAIDARRRERRRPVVAV